MNRTQVVLAVQEAMTPEERSTFLQKFTWLNPRWQGAHVADVLDELDNRDSDLTLVERLYAEHGGEVPEPGLLGAATRVFAVMHDSASWNQVYGLVERTRKILAMSCTSVESTSATS